jgi:sialate O-acetylesterase
MIVPNMRILAFLFVFTAALWADVRLPALISDNMLLQAGKPLRIWGWASPEEAVTVEFRGQTARATADAIGRWETFLMPVAAGGPFELKVSGTNAITVTNVLVGEVWVGSGQSNMQWSVKQADNPEQEIAAANYPQIRLFRVALKASDVALDDVTGKWEECSPTSVGDFSAVAYYFGRHLHQQKKTPVGLIQSAWGGTPADAWTSLAAIASDATLMPAVLDYARMVAAYPPAKERYDMEKKAGKNPRMPNGPVSSWALGGLYNAMIAPLTRYTIQGAVWYQGESNAAPTRVGIYSRLMQTMIKDWRRAWGQGDFPFLFVQLANFKSNGLWPELREAQTDTMTAANTGMAVTIDIGNPTDIHPRNKQDVGMRLALWARALTYGDKLVYSGPLYRTMTREGSSARVWFDHVGGGLKAKDGTLKGFEIAGPDGKWSAAEARIDGSTVVVSAADVSAPSQVRYAWSDVPEASLFNAEGLPASPFRTR